MNFRKIFKKIIQIQKHTRIFTFVLAILILGFATFIYFSNGTAEPKTARADAVTCYWVGDVSPSNWNNASHWSNISGGAGGNTCDGGPNIPGADDTVVFDGGSINTATVDADVSVAAIDVQAGYGATITQVANVTVAGDVSISSGTWEVKTFNLDTGSGDLSIGGIVTIGISAATGITTTDVAVNGGGALTASGNSKINVAGSWSNSGTFTKSTSTVTFNAGSAGKTLSGTLDGTSAFNNIKFDNVNGGWTLFADLSTASFTLSNGTFNTNNNKITVLSGVTYGVYSQTGGTFNAGSSDIYTGNFSVTGGAYNAQNSTLLLTMTSSVGTLNFVGGGYTFNNVTFRKLVAAAGGTIALGAGTFNFTGNFYLLASSSPFTVSAVTNSPIVNIDGDLSFDSGAQSEALAMGSNTWTVSGNVNFTTGTVTAGGSTLIMDGDGKTLTGYNRTLNNLTISAGISTVTTATSISGTLIVDAGKTLTLNAGLNMNKGSTTTINGTIDGASVLRLTDTAGTNLSTSGILSAPVRFNVATTAAIVPARTYGGAVEFYNNTATNYTATLGKNPGETIIFQSDFNLNANSTGNMIIDATVQDPNINIAGNLDFTGIGGGSESIIVDLGTWTLGGNVDFTNGTFTAGSSSVIFNGAGAQSITSAGNGLNNLTIANASNSGITFADSLTVSGIFTDLTSDSKLTFSAGLAYVFANINIGGSSGHSIIMRSSIDGTQWNFNVSQLIPAVSYVDVKDSNASGGSQITATYSLDSGNNINWLFVLAPSPSPLSDITVPFLSISYPYYSNWWTYGDSIPIRGMVSDDESGLDRIWLYNQQTEETINVDKVNDDGYFEQWLDLEKSSKNIVQVKTQDRAGNLTTQELNIYQIPLLGKYIIPESALVGLGTQAVTFISIYDDVLDKEIDLRKTKEPIIYTQKPLFKGTTIPGGKVDLYINNAQEFHFTTQADLSGNWQYQFTQPLDYGQHTIFASVTDKEGNVSQQTDKLAFTVKNPSEMPFVSKIGKNLREFQVWWIFAGIAILVFIGLTIIYLKTRKKEHIF